MDRVRPSEWIHVSDETTAVAAHRDLKIDSEKLCRDSRMRYRKRNMTDAEMKEWLDTQYDVNDNGCWVWRKQHSTGYGHVTWRGKEQSVHRVYWLLCGRIIPDDLGLLHGKDCSKACFNPDHLHPGDQHENNLDRHRDGTMPCKLTQEQVLEIRARTHETNRKLAEEYGVAKTTISGIINRQTWSWL